MFKDFVMQTAGIELAPLISLCLFMVFFSGLIIRVLTYSKAHIAELGKMPLDNDDAENSYQKLQHKSEK